jgi:hypothetical protein
MTLVGAELAGINAVRIGRNLQVCYAGRQAGEGGNQWTALALHAESARPRWKLSYDGRAFDASCNTATNISCWQSARANSDRAT